MLPWHRGIISVQLYMQHICYLSNDEGKLASKVTGLSLDELEHVAGRFTKTSHRAGQLRGELVEDNKGRLIIRHHFTKKKLWINE